MMKMIFVGLMLAGVSCGVMAQVDLCTKFIPASNKQFNDTVNLNKIVVTRSGKYIRGTIAHSVGKTVANATFTDGVCVGNQLSFSWRTSAFYGTFTGSLICINQIYNIQQAYASINGKPVDIGTMISESTGQACPALT